MTHTVAISGCSGGKNGPLGLYPALSKVFERFHAVDTVPSDYQANISKTSDFVLKNNFNSLVICGYSMGATVALHTAFKLKNEGYNVRAMVLFAPDGESYNGIEKIDIPLLVFHPENDECFNPSVFDRAFEGRKGVYKRVIMKGFNHDFESKDSITSEEFAYQVGVTMIKFIGQLS